MMKNNCSFYIKKCNVFENNLYIINRNKSVDIFNIILIEMFTIIKKVNFPFKIENPQTSQADMQCIKQIII